ncbi:MAG: Wzy polymerase domain-containing protein [Methylophaga sp.]
MIQWLVEGGIVAFIGMLLVVAGVLLAAQKSLSGKRAALYAGMLLPIALHTQVEIPFYLSALHWLVFIMLLFMVLRHQAAIKQMTMTVAANRLLTGLIWLFSGLLLWFYIHTVLANRDFLDYYAGNHGETVLPYAYNNPYLAEQARWIDLSAILYSAIERNQQEPVRYYIQWGEALKANHPDVDLYIKLVDAYEFLQNRQEYCETAAEGLAIYPESGRLQNAVEFCKY